LILIFGFFLIFFTMHIGFNTAQWQRQMITHTQSSTNTAVNQHRQLHQATAAATTTNAHRFQHRAMATSDDHPHPIINNNAINIKPVPSTTQTNGSCKLRKTQTHQQAPTNHQKWRNTPIEDYQDIDMPTHISNTGDARPNQVAYDMPKHTPPARQTPRLTRHLYQT
jgi:cytoskeletal protein RodZ